MRDNVRAVHWRAVVIGFGVGFVIAILGEATAVGELLLPDGGGYVLAGLLGGFVAGFVAGGSAGTGAFTGGLASVFGGLGVLLLEIYAIPGAIGGVIGAAVKGRWDGSTAAERPV